MKTTDMIDLVAKATEVDQLALPKEDKKVYLQGIFNLLPTSIIVTDKKSLEVTQRVIKELIEKYTDEPKQRATTRKASSKAKAQAEGKAKENTRRSTRSPKTSVSRAQSRPGPSKP